MLSLVWPMWPLCWASFGPFGDHITPTFWHGMLTPSPRYSSITFLSDPYVLWTNKTGSLQACSTTPLNLPAISSHFQPHLSQVAKLQNLQVFEAAKETLQQLAALRSQWCSTTSQAQLLQRGRSAVQHSWEVQVAALKKSRVADGCNSAWSYDILSENTSAETVFLGPVGVKSEVSHLHIVMRNPSNH